MDCCDAEKEEPQEVKNRLNPNPNFLVWLIMGVATIVAIAAGFLIAGKTGSASLSPSNAQAYVAQAVYDWGEIDINGGDVTYQFVVENQGTDELKIANLKTSCACTTVQVTINGQRSPYFGMHTSSSWIGQIEPGEKAIVEAIFDPLFHGPSGVGPIERMILIETNDAQNPVLEFKLTGNVVKR